MLTEGSATNFKGNIIGAQFLRILNQKVLFTLTKTIKPSVYTYRKAVKEHYDFRRRCNSFFMELVSLFCFGANAGDGGMDPELFAMFMSYVIEGSSKTKDFSPFPEHGIDATPVVRSFLLQQLLRTG